MNNSVEVSYVNYYLVLTIGLIILLLGLFMTTGIHLWNIFEVWLPLGLVITGIVMSSTRVYSKAMGVAFLFLGAAIWLHQILIVEQPQLTMLIDWSFVALGCLIALLSLVGILLKRRATHSMGGK